MNNIILRRVLTNAADNALRALERVNPDLVQQYQEANQLLKELDAAEKNDDSTEKMYIGHYGEVVFHPKTIAYMKVGQKIDAIKSHRVAGSNGHDLVWGLKEAKDQVEYYMKSKGLWED